jgi:hypothetical protein
VSDLLSNDVVGVVTWLGTAATLIGLWFTYDQASKARSAAEAAESAVENLEGRLTIANFAYAGAQLSVVQTHISGGNFPAAVGIFDVLRRMILQSCDLLDPDGRRVETVAQIRRNIQTIDRQLDYAQHNTTQFRLERATRAISGLAGALTTLEGDATFVHARSDLQ